MSVKRLLEEVRKIVSKLPDPSTFTPDMRALSVPDLKRMRGYIERQIEEEPLSQEEAADLERLRGKIVWRPGHVYPDYRGLADGEFWRLSALLKKEGRTPEEDAELSALEGKVEWKEASREWIEKWHPRGGA